MSEPDDAALVMLRMFEDILEHYPDTGIIIENHEEGGFRIELDTDPATSDEPGSMALMVSAVAPSIPEAMAALHARFQEVRDDTREAIKKPVCAICSPKTLPDVFLRGFVAGAVNMAFVLSGRGVEIQAELCGQHKEVVLVALTQDMDALSSISPDLMNRVRHILSTEKPRIIPDDRDRPTTSLRSAPHRVSRRRRH